MLCTGFDYEYDPGSTGDTYIRATKIISNTTGVVTHLSCELENATGNVIMALYTDNSGTPDALLAKTLATACTIGINTIAVIATAAVTNAVTYWIAFQNSSSNAIKLNFSAPAGTSYYTTNTPTMVIQDPMPSSDGGLLARGYSLCMTIGETPPVSSGIVFPPPPAYVRL